LRKNSGHLIRVRRKFPSGFIRKLIDGKIYMTMNKSKTVLTTLSLAAATAFAGSALAQSATQETGAYAGLSIGQSKSKDACSGGTLPGVSTSCDDTDTAWKIFGGYQFMRYLAAEVAYTDFGKVKASASASGVSASAEVKSNAWELVAVGSYPIGTSGFAPYVKAGFYRGESKASGDVTGKDTNNDWTAGIGVRYDIMRNFAVRAEWQRYNSVGGDNAGKSDIDVLSIGALYKF
jgi:OmpA-OmpF porin, OOP family